MEWGYSQAEVRVGTDNNILRIAKAPVVAVRVVNHTLNITWEGAWGTWDDLAKSPEVAHLTARANEVLSGASEKGNGKVKKGGTGAATAT
eukprot:2167254-Pyramimonas_sp.AAC.1